MNSYLHTVYADCRSPLGNSAARSSSFELQHFISSPFTLPKSCQCRNCPEPLVAPRPSHPHIPSCSISFEQVQSLLTHPCHLVILSPAQFSPFSKWDLARNRIISMIHVYILWKHVCFDWWVTVNSCV